MRLASFMVLLGLLTIYTGIHAQLLSPTRPWLGWGLLLIFVGLMVVWQRLHHADQGDPDRWRYRVLAWSGTIAMGIWATFLFFCFAADLLGLFFLIVQWIRPGLLPVTAQAIEHLPVLLIGPSLALAGVGLVQAIRGPRVVHVRVPIPHLTEALSGLKIALISDLHMGPTIGTRYVADVVDRTLALAPDLIAVTGDLADETVEHLTVQSAPLERLKAPHGVYYVPGNHEYYWGVQAWLAKVRSLGWTSLLNENRLIPVNGERVCVAGITDAQGAFLPGHRPDVTAAAQGSDQSALRVLLSHRPGVYSEAERAGFDLQLSGHTHGGQFFPWSLVIPFVHRFYKDLNRFRRLWIYVNPGTGYWGPPHRFLVPSEITLLELIPSA